MLAVTTTMIVMIMIIKMIIKINCNRNSNYDNIMKIGKMITVEGKKMKIKNQLMIANQKNKSYIILICRLHMDQYISQSLSELITVICHCFF